MLFRKLNSRIDGLYNTLQGIVNADSAEHALIMRALELQRSDMEVLKARISQIIQNQKQDNITMDARIQRAIDALTKLDDRGDSLEAANKAFQTEITGLKAERDALQQKIDSGAGITSEDLAALNDRITNIEDLNAAMPEAVEANTEDGSNSG